MRVAVIGGGIIGLSVAWQCGLRGLDVTVYDDAPGGGASGVAAGMLAPVAEAYFGEEILLHLSLASMARWQAFAAALGDVGYRTDGTLLVGRTADDLRELARFHALYRDWGLPVEQVAARELEPSLAPRIRGGLRTPGDHQVDPRRVVSALLGRVRLERRRVTPEEVDADVVVLATGCEAPAARPVQGQILRLRGRVGLRHVIRAHVEGSYVYLVPRADGEVVVGATTAERGFDRTVRAGEVHELLDTALQVAPELADLELVEARAGLRPGTPDNAPLIGRLSDRVLVAAGHYRHGVLLAPITAEVVTALICGEKPAVDLTPFEPGRFA